VPTNKQRRESARRHLERQLQRRQEREARQRKITLIASISGTIVLIGVIVLVVVIWSGGDKKKTAAAGSTTSPSATTSTSPSATTSPSSAPSYPCSWTKTGAASKKATVPSTTTPSRKGTVLVDVATSRGALTFTLNRAAAPCAVESFVSLSKQKYFDSTPCHRLTTTGIYVLQCGDPGGTGSGGPGYSFDDELTGHEKYTRGVLAMANSGADTNGSQFFIVYKNSTLGPSYTVFGTVSKGLAVVDKVAAGGANPVGDGKPKLPISLTNLKALG